MQYYNNTLCISFPELVNSDVKPNVVGENAFISRYDYINLSKKGALVSIRRGSRSTPALYQFDMLPIDIQMAVSAKNKDIVKKAEQETVKNILQHDYKALNFFQKYTLPNGESLKENTITEYCATAMVLNTIIRLQSDSKAWRQALGGTAQQHGSFKKLLTLLDTFQPKWGWKLPAGERAVKNKIVKYKKDGYKSLVSGKLCNENAAKIAESEQEALLRRIMATGRNFDDVQVMNMYNIAADAAGWKRLASKSTVANKRSEWQIYTDAGSRGKINHDNVHAMQVKRHAPNSPLLYWTVDGWDVELLYQKSTVDSKGHNVVRYDNRLTAVIVLDPCEKYPIGYAIGTHETPALIREAIRNAVKHTAELFGDLHIVHQLQTDRYGKGTLTPFYEAVSEIYTPARAKNAKAKVIEPYFKRLNKNHCQFRPNWSGFGITSNKELQPNAEYLNKIRKSFPDEKGCIQQIVEMIEAERRLKVDAYKTAYPKLKEDFKHVLTHEEFLLRLGETTGDTNRLAGSGVNFQFKKQKFFYDSFDPAFRQYRNEDWVLRFDPSDMSNVLATGRDNSLRFMLEEKYDQPMALAERSNGDAEQLHKIFNYNNDLIEDILDVQERDYEALNSLFNKMPVIEETLGKLLLIDSNGQHKDNRNNARMMRVAEQKQLQEQQSEAISDREAYLATTVNINDFLNNNI